MYVYMYLCLYICIYVCMYALCVYVCMYVCMHVCMYVHTRVDRSSFTVFCMEKDMIITIAFLTQKNVTMAQCTYVLV